MMPQPLQELRARLTAYVQRFPRRLPAATPAELERYWAGAEAASRRVMAGIRARLPDALPRLHPETGLVLVVGAMLAGGGYFAFNDYATSRLQRELDLASGDVAARLKAATDRHVELAASAAALFARPGAETSRWAFFGFARTALGNSPELGAIEWIPRVAQGRRSAFEKRASADGLFDFQFVQRAPDGSRVRAPRREEYYPVFFVEPYPGNEAELGIDLAADGRTAAMLERVRDSGEAAAAPTGPKAQGVTAVPGYSILTPVYRSNVAPFTVAERRKTLSGFVRAKFRLDRLLGTLRADVAGLSGLELHAVDRTDDGNPVLLHSLAGQRDSGSEAPAGAKALYEGPHVAIAHQVAGWRWNVVIRPARGAFPGMLGLTASGFAAFTLLLTALLLRHLSTMRRAREQAEAANRAKSDFLAMMSHELRTPLNAVIGFSEMMINELFGPLSNDHYKEYTSHINRSATHLLGLINSILDLSRIEAGYYRLTKETFSIRETWETTYPILQASLRDSGVEVVDNISGSPLELHADPGVFRQILHNLVSNAIKFTPQGGKVSVAAETGPGGEFLLRVSDSGIGIAQKDIDLVLRPFGQVDSSLARKFDGVGLGLPLTRMLVELHGGELRIDSEPNEGTEVTVVFPADSIVRPGDPRARPDSAAREPLPAAPAVPMPDPRRLASARK